jgi:CheY-like chemotaxis protein
MYRTLLSYLENIETASRRARDLVKQMLVFSHSEKTEKRPQDMKHLVSENIDMLRKVLPSSIRINIDLDDELPQVLLDPVQLQQMIMNLCLNAKDAMQASGTMNIRLGWHRNINRECNACHKRIQGDWIELSVSDDGSGMDNDVVERIFEPFFTTKEVGQGTGMGMSVLHAIIDSHRGHVFIDTQKNQGSCFHLIFPPLSTPTETEASRQTASLNSVGNEQGRGQGILIVDDEPALTEFMQELLTNNGYNCSCHHSSLDALQAISRQPDAFDLVITDQTMPDLTGVEMVSKIRDINPTIPVILATGYSEDIDAQRAGQLDIHFLDKPVSAAHLLESVALLLDKNSNTPPAGGKMSSEPSKNRSA